MNDISAKGITLRTAKAVSIIKCSAETLDKAMHGKLKKGAVQDIATSGALIGAKQTQFIIPHCHPVSIDGMEVSHQFYQEGESIEELNTTAKYPSIVTFVEAKSIGRTGIEMEALMAASISSLTIYDMCKYLGDKHLEIVSTKLLLKKGGKSDKAKLTVKENEAALLVCSQDIVEGKREDKVTGSVKEHLAKNNCELVAALQCNGTKTDIQEQVNAWVERGIPFIFTAGGTGITPSDVAADALREIMDCEAEGIAEAMRNHGGLRTPLAMLSRSVAVVIKNSLVITLPGSSSGAQESLDAIIPYIFKVK